MSCSEWCLEGIQARACLWWKYIKLLFLCTHISQHWCKSREVTYIWKWQGAAAATSLTENMANPSLSWKKKWRKKVSPRILGPQAYLQVTEMLVLKIWSGPFQTSTCLKIRASPWPNRIWFSSIFSTIQGVLISLCWWENLVLHENCLLGKKDVVGNKLLKFLGEIPLKVGGRPGTIIWSLEAQALKWLWHHLPPLCVIPN